MFIDDVIEPLKKKFPTPDGEIGFAHGRLHSFRHFFCSQAFLGYASEGEIKEWLGHADSKMVEHYRHLRSEDAQRKMARLTFYRQRKGVPPKLASGFDFLLSVLYPPYRRQQRHGPVVQEHVQGAGDDHVVRGLRAGKPSRERPKFDLICPVVVPVTGTT